MNANELADALEDGLTNYTCVHNQEAATMLRQQQAEIEKLKVEKIRAYDNGVEDGKKLDTNPKPAKTLTDEEIELMKHFLQANQLYLSFEEWKHGDSARAILRKAQEK